TAALCEADGWFERRIERIVVVLVRGASDQILDRVLAICSRSTEDRARPGAHEPLDLRRAEAKDGRAVDEVVLAFEQVALCLPGEHHLVTTRLVPVRKLHQREVGQLPVQLGPPDAHSGRSIMPPSRRGGQQAASCRLPPSRSPYPPACATWPRSPSQ